MMTNLPTRLSADRDHCWFDDLAFRVKVLLNGEPLEDIITYDTVEGWVDVACRDDDGSLVMDGDMVVLDRYWGEVTVERLN